jgi:predicted metalloprotease with PDZ domain
MVRNICLHLVLGLAVLAVQTEAAAADLSYTLRPICGPAPALTIDLLFSLTPDGPSELVLPNEYGGEREMWRWISKLEVINGAARLKPGKLPFLRKIDAGGEALCHIRYTVSLPPAPLTQGVYRRPVIRGDYIHLLGNTFLVRPNWPERKRLRIGFTWEVPDDWRVGNSFGVEQRRQEFEASPFELVQSVYLAGVRKDRPDAGRHSPLLSLSQ